MDKEQVINIVKEYLKAVKNEGTTIDKAILFGSYAHENATADSDIDLMIVSKDFDKGNDRLYGKVWALTRKISTKIEPFIIGWDKFQNDDYSPLIQIVKENGFEIV